MSRLLINGKWRTEKELKKLVPWGHLKYDSFILCTNNYLKIIYREQNISNYTIQLTSEQARIFQSYDEITGKLILLIEDWVNEYDDREKIKEENIMCDKMKNMIL